MRGAEEAAVFVEVDVGHGEGFVGTKGRSQLEFSGRGKRGVEIQSEYVGKGVGEGGWVFGHRHCEAGTS